MKREPLDVAAFASTQLLLLSRELEAELSETALLASHSSPSTLQRAGLALINLHVSSQRTGLGGKTVVELELDPAIGEGDLPEHGLRVGDIVGVRESVGGSAKKKERGEAERRGIEGVVVKVARGALSVAAEGEEVDVPGGRVWIIKLANDVTYKRMNQVMQRMQKLSEADQSVFMQVLFGKCAPTPLPASIEESVGKLEWVSESLNDSQKDAIKFAMASKEIALIHGPPGTGKTHTIIELVLQLLKFGLKLLVCGPSNISVDNIVERLAPHKVSMIRLGHPARLLPSVLSHSLDVLTKTSDAAALVQDVRKEMDEKQASIRKTRSGRERKAIYGDLRELRKEYRDRERGCVDNLLRESKVVLATLHGAGGFQLRQAQFDIVIIDEASQALEAQCWVPLLTAKKAILAGDHLQLPPTIKSLNSKHTAHPSNDKDKGVNDAAPGENNPEATKLGTGATLEKTLFDRLLTLHGPSIKRMLTTQYRMHEEINAFPSAELYESKLVPAEAVRHHLLCELEGVDKTDDTSEPLIFYDTQGDEYPEKAEEEDLDKKKGKGLAESKSNDMEAALVASHIERLVTAGVKPEHIAVITPYNAQLSRLSQLLKERFLGIELGSVDGFQGREKEVVVVSLVRSNPEREVGFLGEKRRLNVAMTRPRRQLTIVGDSETIGRGSKFLRRWMKFLEGHADLRYPDPSELLAAS